MENKNKLLTFVLSAIPGAGHMYLGYMKMGMQLMALFFSAIFLSDWLRLSILMVFIPIVWFYGMFDALAKCAAINLKEKENREYDFEQNLGIFKWLTGNYNFISKKNKILGWGLILIGSYMTFERVVLPNFINYIEFWEYFKVLAIAALLIGIGIRFLIGSKSKV